MSQSVVTYQSFIAVLTQHGETVHGISLPECYSAHPRLKFRPGFNLGTLTGQRQTDGEGNTQRYEVAIPARLIRLMLMFGFGIGWELDLTVSRTLWEMVSKGLPLCIWVKPEDIILPDHE